MSEILKPIIGFDQYFISNYGNVYSNKSGSLKQLSPFVDSKGNYMVIALIANNGQRKKCLVHRLVATAFIPNPKNLPEVNHKDKNKKNNTKSNLEWCTRIDNLKDSYLTMSPNRNFDKCKLFVDDVFISEFDGVTRAAKYAKENFGASASSLEKYLRWSNIRIELVNKTNRKEYGSKVCSKTQNRNTIKVYKDDCLIGEFKKYKDVQIYLETQNIFVSENWVRIAKNRGSLIHGFKIIR